MNSTLKMIWISTLVFLIGTTLILGGMMYLHTTSWMPFSNGWMMNGYNHSANGWNNLSGMMSGRGFYGNMMGGSFANGRTGCPGYSNGMMGSEGCGSGMMNGYGSPLSGSTTPLTVSEAKSAVEDYLTNYGYNDLSIKEIMIFDNNAYAILAENTTGIGTFELLVDPNSKLAFPEYGANMMWNTKYGMHAGGGMMGGNLYNNSGEMAITADKAAEIAQSYLDSTRSGEKVSDEVSRFYGYYTIDTLKDGKVYGMLSVNGYDGTVIYHTWHGTFIDMVENP